MNNSALKGAFGALAIVGIALAAKKISERKKVMRGILNEYEIKERTPFGFADKIREMNDEQYNELKNKMKKHFSSRCCRTGDRHQNEEAA